MNYRFEIYIHTISHPKVLLELARGRNIAPLPLIKPHCGLRLPPDRYCLIAANYKLKAAVQPKKMVKSAIEARSTIKTQIKGGPGPMKRQSTGANVKTQNVTIPKPVFKFSSTPKMVVAKPKSEVKIEIEEDSTSSVKRKREEDDFEMVG